MAPSVDSFFFLFNVTSSSVSASAALVLSFPSFSLFFLSDMAGDLWSGVSCMFVSAPPFDSVLVSFFFFFLGGDFSSLSSFLTPSPIFSPSSRSASPSLSFVDDFFLLAVVFFFFSVVFLALGSVDRLRFLATAGFFGLTLSLDTMGCFQMEVVVNLPVSGVKLEQISSIQYRRWSFLAATASLATNTALINWVCTCFQPSNVSVGPEVPVSAASSRASSSCSCSSFNTLTDMLSSFPDDWVSTSILWYGKEFCVAFYCLGFSAR